MARLLKLKLALLIIPKRTEQGTENGYVGSAFALKRNDDREYFACKLRDILVYSNLKVAILRARFCANGHLTGINGTSWLMRLRQGFVNR